MSASLPDGTPIQSTPPKVLLVGVFQHSNGTKELFVNPDNSMSVFDVRAVLEQIRESLLFNAINGPKHNPQTSIVAAPPGMQVQRNPAA